jgi:hypothetical protein
MIDKLWVDDTRLKDETLIVQYSPWEVVFDPIGDMTGAGLAS